MAHMDMYERRGFMFVDMKGTRGLVYMDVYKKRGLVYIVVYKYEDEGRGFKYSTWTIMRYGGSSIVHKHG